MRTHAWAMKDLNTQLASWTELRHDTILYAKESYTSSFACSYPKGFVEPRSAFWERCRDMAQTVSALLAKTDYGSATKLRHDQIAFLDHFADVAQTLLNLSEKELHQQPFTPEETDFISTTLVGFKSYVGYWTVRDGWYPKLYYPSQFVSPPPGLPWDQVFGSTRWDPLIADVHTDVPCSICNDPGSVLEEGTGNVNLLMVAMDNGADHCVYAGPVFSHYEFATPGSTQR
jgi:hypothetical protein